MENKVVCDYCGMIYDGSREKCPLCGSTTRAEAAPAAPRRRLTEEERKARRRTQQEEQRAQQDAQRARREEDRQARLEERRRVPQKQRSSKAPETQGGIPRGYLRAAVVFLTMAVLVVLFFIGDMIGWWPGLEDVLRATTPSETAAAQDAALAEQLALEEARANKLAWTADAASLEARVPSDELAAEALAVGREDGGILARLAALATGRELKPRAAYAETAVESLASDIDAAIGDPRVDYGIVVEDGTASVTEGHDGFMVNRDELRRTLDELLLGQEDGSRSFVARAEHAPLRIDESAAQDACDAVNAAIADGARFTYEGAAWSASASDVGSWVSTRIDGSSLAAFVDAAKAKPALLAHVAEVGKGDPVHVSFEVADDDVIVRTDGEGAIPLVAEATGLLDAALFGDDGKARTGVGAGAPVEVAIGSGPAPEAMPFDEAMDLGVIGAIASYTTEYATGPGTEARNHNIALVSQYLSDSVAKPGDSWSFNGTAGDCSTEERGFKGAGAIVDGEYDDAIGGGICQVATTVFNAVYDAGYPVPTRHNHSLYIASYPAGRDAAVSWDELDLVWKNDGASDVLMRTSYTDTSVTVTLYGVDPGYHVSTDVGEWTEGEKHKTKTERDDSMAPGTSYVKTAGTDGRKITVIRTVTSSDGSILHEDPFYSTYDPITEVVVAGPETQEKTDGAAAGDDAAKKQNEER